MISNVHESESGCLGQEYTQSEVKLRNTATSLNPWFSNCSLKPCCSIDELHGYRSKCSFQLVRYNGSLKYAVRKNQLPIVIDNFPMANLRIQSAMRALLLALNRTYTTLIMSPVQQGLTGVSFSSSWKNTEDADCLVTLQYDRPIAKEREWIIEAGRICSEGRFAQVTGRSKKQVLRAVEGECRLRDTIWMVHRDGSYNWFVTLIEPIQRMDYRTIAVQYEKEEGVFFHPNARAMCEALQWMLGRLSVICNDLNRRLHLLEMYSGCGAHTLALLKTGLLDKITAVEMNARLVAACRRNLELNKVPIGPSIEIVASDAIAFLDKRVQTLSEFDVLLVDPPRGGLGERFCFAVTRHRFQHLLYVSCGKDALLRDLHLLSGDYMVANCMVIDLFPGTTSVESILHLRRRSLRNPSKNE